MKTTLGRPPSLVMILLAFLVSASLVTSSRFKRDVAASDGAINPTRRGCVEVYKQNGQQIINEDGEPQFTCGNYFPTTQQIEARIASTGLLTDPNKIPVYYTGWSYNEVENELRGWISEWINNYLARQPSPQPQATGYYWWWTAVPRVWWYAQNNWFVNHQGDGPEFTFPPRTSNVFDACISESIATMNVGREIFLFVPSEYVLGSEPNRQWWSTEYPLLTSNPAVEKIYRVDPRPAADGRVCGESVIWATDSKPQPQTWFCAEAVRRLPLPPSLQPGPAQSSFSRSISQTSSNNNDHIRLFRRECWALEDLEGNWEYDTEQCDDYLPTLAQCQGNLQQKNRINDAGYVPVYYTGWPDGIAFADITTWIASYMESYITNQEDKPNGWYWFWSALNLDWYSVQQNYVSDNFYTLKNLNLDAASITEANVEEVLTICLCEALAVSCVASTVVLMVPFDYVLGSETGRHWWTIEFGALTKNPHVNRIYRIDPSPLSTLEDPGASCDDPGRWVPLLIWTRGIDPEAPQTLACATFVTGADVQPHAVLPPPPVATPQPPAPPTIPSKRDALQSAETLDNGTHFNPLTRRECVATTDTMTGQIQYLPENCDDMAPTAAQCQEHLKRVDPSSGEPFIDDVELLPIYYTGWDFSAQRADLLLWIDAFVTNYIKVQKGPKAQGWYWFWRTLDVDWYDVQERYLLDNKAKIQNVLPAGQIQDLDAIMDNCMVEAFADSCVGPKVFLMVPQGYVLGSEAERHWWTIEYGALTRNPNVQEIFRLDPSPHDTDDECTGYAPMLIWSRGVDDEVELLIKCSDYVSDTAIDPTSPPPDSGQAASAPANPLRRVEKPWGRAVVEQANKGFANVSVTFDLLKDMKIDSDKLEIARTKRKSEGFSEPLHQRLENSTINNVQTRSSFYSERKSESEAIQNRHQKPDKTINRRKCNEKTGGQVDTRWDCDLNLPTQQQHVTEIQVGGVTSQEDASAVYCTGLDANDMVIGRLKGSIAALMKWYIKSVLENHQLEGTSGSKYQYWYFDVAYDADGDWFAAQDGGIEMHLPPNAIDDEEIYFTKEASVCFGKCTSQESAVACEPATVILFAPHDCILADHSDQHFYCIENGVRTRNPKVQRVIRVDLTPPEDPNQPRSPPTVIWDRLNPAINAQILQVFDCEDAIREPPPDQSPQGLEDSDSEER